ncbi:hypothetical protein MMPV_004755 [Pyropia vietnamensis]
MAALSATVVSLGVLVVGVRDMATLPIGASATAKLELLRCIIPVRLPLVMQVAAVGARPGLTARCDHGGEGVKKHPIGGAIRRTEL